MVVKTVKNQEKWSKIGLKCPKSGKKLQKLIEMAQNKKIA
jgi:hypothetical protein